MRTKRGHYWRRVDGEADASFRRCLLCLAERRELPGWIYAAYRSNPNTPTVGTRGVWVSHLRLGCSGTAEQRATIREQLANEPKRAFQS